MISLDTNILIYAADRTAGTRHFAAHQLVTAAISGKVGLTEQSLVEFLNAAVRKVKLPFADAAAAMRGYATHFAVLIPPATIVDDVIGLLAQYRLSAWDARLLAVCAAHGCTHLFSEDMQDGARYGGVTIVNPFKPANAAIIQQALAP